jgi:tRNA-dihydrouridine synthase B
MTSKVIYLAPLQESTDAVYRKSHAEVFRNVDKYFAPYIVRQNDGSVKNSHLRDFRPERNEGYHLVPQVLAGNSDDLIFLSKLLSDAGYDEVNWNLGCPYPMVTNKGMGCGLLPLPHKIEEILYESLPKISCRISVKLRSGFESPDDINAVIPVLNQFPLHEIILHPRIAKQLYNGTADPEVFIHASALSKNPLVYNGDILTLDDFNRLDRLFGDKSVWMIGRGILGNPFLPSDIKGITLQQSRPALLQQFHNRIFDEYSELLSGKSHLLMRMLKFWSYFCFSFPDPHKTLKRIKKAGSLAKYHEAVTLNFHSLTDHEEN